MPRLRWLEIPGEVRAAVEKIAGGPTVRVQPVTGGFSPCFAGVVTTTRGRAFAKAVSAAQNAESPEFLRREIDAVAVLPHHAGAPRLLGSFDDGDWVAIVLEHIDGRPPASPWTDTELAAALAALASVNALAAPTRLVSTTERLTPLFDGWRRMVAEDGVPPRWNSHVGRLLALEADALGAVAGDQLVHGDVRADNLLVTRDGHVILVDWAHTSRGAPWVDLVLWLPALALEGVAHPERVFDRGPMTLRPPQDGLLAVTAALTGFLLHRGRQPDPSGLPTLRTFQLAQAKVAADILARLLRPIT